jgi:hypothetical protein
MKGYPFDRELSNESDVLEYYLDAIEYRTAHKDGSPAIAIHVFDKTHPALKLSFRISRDVDHLRDGFGSLEAPGMPEDDNKDPDEDVDEAWQLLLDRVNKVKQNRIA